MQMKCAVWLEIFKNGLLGAGKSVIKKARSANARSDWRVSGLCKGWVREAGGVPERERHHVRFNTR
jgi:hypothetical protein